MSDQEQSSRRMLLEIAVPMLAAVDDFLEDRGVGKVEEEPAEPRRIFSQLSSEEDLAKLQQNQGSGNDCGVFASSAAIQHLLGGPDAPINVDYKAMVEIADSNTLVDLTNPLSGVTRFLGGKDFRLWPGGPTAPWQQANLVRHIGEAYRNPVRAKAVRGTPRDLVRHLSEPGTAVLVTLSWSNNYLPRIASPKGKMLRFSKIPKWFSIGRTDVYYPFNAHIMMLGAYDPEHTTEDDGETVVTPWGFVNSWQDGGEGIYWMPDADFKAGWRFAMPVIGRQKMVIIKRR